MGSFISSSERSLGAGVLTFVLCLAAWTANNFYPDARGQNRVTENRYWLNKVHNQPDRAATIILSGDSRVQRGLDPATIDARVPHARTLNFAFSSGGHNTVMFAQIERMLTDHPACPRVVVLGITPVSLTPAAQKNEQYMDYLRRPVPTPADLDPESLKSRLGYALRPLEPRRILTIATGSFADRPMRESVMNFHLNGWAETDMSARNPRAALADYESVFRDNAVDPAVVSALMEQVRIWRRAGMIVLGYRPPTSPQMVALENSKSGFDEAAFKKAFKKAGGIWFEPQGRFDTYDGSHLEPISARRLSTQIADKIRQAVAQRPKPSYDSGTWSSTCPIP